MFQKMFSEKYTKCSTTNKKLKGEIVRNLRPIFRPQLYFSYKRLMIGLWVKFFTRV